MSLDLVGIDRVDPNPVTAELHRRHPERLEQRGRVSVSWTSYSPFFFAVGGSSPFSRR
jgi:hypothetical protein